MAAAANPTWAGRRRRCRGWNRSVRVKCTTGARRSRCTCWPLRPTPSTGSVSTATHSIEWCEQIGLEEENANEMKRNQPKTTNHHACWARRSRCITFFTNLTSMSVSTEFYWILPSQTLSLGRDLLQSKIWKDIVSLLTFTLGSQPWNFKWPSSD